VYNSMAFLPLTAPAFLSAAEHSGNIELIFVDNGSSDGSVAYLRQFARSGVRVLQFSGGTIAAVRNYGARAASGEFLGFLDADCLIGPDYFIQAMDVIRRTGAVATGCEVIVPQKPHWIEATWQHLHYVGRDRPVHYLNSGNFFVDAATFRDLGGFNEALVTGEDAEIGTRITRRGETIYESTRVAAVHLGNPKSLRSFYRRAVWHGLGMFGTVRHKSLDKPTFMTLVHLASTLAAVAWVLFSPEPIGSLALLPASQFPVPAATVAFRMRQTGRPGRPLHAILLYWLYYWARVHALLLVLLRLDRRYRK
jgi:glycosyltransferase involved in cell wall biosynthesis